MYTNHRPVSNKYAMNRIESNPDRSKATVDIPTQRDRIKKEKSMHLICQVIYAKITRFIECTMSDFQ